VSETEILQITVSLAETLLTVFSVFFGIVSAYVVALYLFLHEAPLILRTLAFFLLTMAFVVIAAMGWHMQYLSEGIHVAWTALQAKSTGMESLGPPFISRTLLVDGRVFTAWASWSLYGIVYVLLAYLTFIYRWPHSASSE
jgi:hypothetical protein